MQQLAYPVSASVETYNRLRSRDRACSPDRIPWKSIASCQPKRCVCIREEKDYLYAVTSSDRLMRSLHDVPVLVRTPRTSESTIYRKATRSYLRKLAHMSAMNKPYLHPTPAASSRRALLDVKSRQEALLYAKLLALRLIDRRFQTGASI
jgi:hypothetical protein